jgi:hypothetical protein
VRRLWCQTPPHAVKRAFAVGQQSFGRARFAAFQRDQKRRNLQFWPKTVQKQSKPRDKQRKQAKKQAGTPLNL